MIDGLEALKKRLNNYLEDESENIVRETISEVGISKRTGQLLDSVKFVGEIQPWYWSLVVESDYASYLNEGYDPFDMKPGLMGKTVPLQTPEGLIFRKVGPNSKGWIHPGWRATNYIALAEKKLYGGILKIVSNSLTELSP